MAYILSEFILFLGAISVFIKNGDKYLVIFLLTLWILYWGSYSNADYDNYNLVYETLLQGGVSFDTSQLGLTLLMSIFSSLGFAYYQFLMILSFVGLFLISSTILRYTSKPNFVYLLYFIHPFFLDVVQVKHFLAMSVIVFSLRYIIDNYRASHLKYITGVLIATSFHYISIFFLPLIFLKKFKAIYIFVIVVVTSLVIVMLDYFNFIYMAAVILVPPERVQQYFENRANLGFLVQFLIQILMLTFVYLSRCRLIRTTSSVFAEKILMINIYLLVLFPFYMINGTFERAFRMILIPNYVLFSLTFIEFRVRERILYLMSLLIFVVLLFLLHVYVSNRDTVFYPILEYNYLFDLFGH